jgi:hypothetical protein
LPCFSYLLLTHSQLWKSSASWRNAGKKIARKAVMKHFGKQIEPYHLFTGKAFNQAAYFKAATEAVEDLTKGCRFARYRQSPEVHSLSNATYIFILPFA